MKLKTKKSVTKTAEKKTESKAKKAPANPVDAVVTELPDRCGIKDVARLYAAENDVAQNAAEAIIRSSVDAICETLASGHDIAFVGYFSMTRAQRKAKTGINPRTGEKMQVPAATVVKFKAGAKLKEAVNK